MDWEIAGRYRTTRYFKTAVPVTMIVEPGPAGDYLSLTIRRGPEKHGDSGWTYEAFKTDERDTVVGETCEVWNVARHVTNFGPQKARRELNKLSCVTPDGIELWHKFAGTNYAGTWLEAISLERRAVPDSDVRPPADLFNWLTWAGSVPGPATGSATPGDATVILEPESRESTRGPKVSTTRRHYPWNSTELVEDDGKRSLSLRNMETGLSLRLEKYADGRFAQLSIGKYPPETAASLDRFKPVKTGREEIILGESCAWFDMMPGAYDIGRSECQTADGLVLKSVQGGRHMFTPNVLVATSIKRAPVPLAGVLPPQSVFVPRNWGLVD